MIASCSLHWVALPCFTCKSFSGAICQWNQPLNDQIKLFPSLIIQLGTFCRQLEHKDYVWRHYYALKCDALHKSAVQFMDFFSEVTSLIKNHISARHSALNLVKTNSNMKCSLIIEEKCQSQKIIMIFSHFCCMTKILKQLDTKSSRVIYLYIIYFSPNQW